jgi:NADH-quinone oxidoreductase subunit J
MDALLFYGFAAVTVIGALLCVAQRNAIYSALSLIMSFTGLFFLYLMLHAHFLAFIHLMVYAGAIMVLFVFVIQLLDQNDEGAQTSRSPVSTLLALSVGILPTGVVLGLITKHLSPTPDVASRDFGTIEQIGGLFFRRFVFPFELTGVLLLAAMVGAVVLAKRKV